MRLSAGILIVSLIISVATLALVLMLLIETPWESAMTEADVRDVIQSESSRTPDNLCTQDELFSQ